MRLSVILLCAGFVVGCSSGKRTPPASAGPPAPMLGVPTPPLAPINRSVVVTPGRATTGRVASVNAPGHFVVLTFPLGTMPASEKRLNVYRTGLKVGEVKISGAPLD